MDKARVVALFIGVVRAGSFSQAAVDAGLTPQAVSKAVRQLEVHLGVRLFHRTTRSLTPTDEGARLFELACPGLRLLDEALDQVQSSRDEMAGLVRIAAPSSIGRRVLLPLIKSFQERYPATCFDLMFDDHFTDLVEARIDIGFRAGNPPERNMVSRRLTGIPLLICASPAYIERHGKPENIEQLLTHRCTGFRQPNSGRLLPWEFNIDGATIYRDVPAVVTFNNVEAEVDAVLDGIGIGQLGLYMVEEEIRQGRLQVLMPELSSANNVLYMYYQQRTQMPMRVRHFIDHVIAAVREASAQQSTIRI